MAPTRRAPLRGERHWRGATAAQRFYISKININYNNTNFKGKQTRGLPPSVRLFDEKNNFYLLSISGLLFSLLVFFDPVY